MRKLKYVGPGFIPGVPAADHTCEDDKQAEELVKGGVFEYVNEPKKGSKEEE